MDNLLRNNKIVLLIAFILSILLWISARGSVNSEGIFTNDKTETLTQQVTVINPSDDVTIENPTRMVNITIHGDQVSLYKALLSASSIHGTVDVQGLAAGKYTLPVKITGLPDAVTPDYTPLQVVLLPNVSQDMTVDLTPEGDLADGFAVGDIKIDPAHVTIKGPQSAISKVHKVTALLSLQKGEINTFTRTLLVRALDNIGQPVEGVRVYPQTVTVTVQVSKPTQTLPVKVQVSGDPKEGYTVGSITANPATVDILGDLGSLTEYPVKTIDISGLSADKTFTVKLASLPGVTQISPSSISVTVRILPLQKKSLTGIPITVTGVPAGYTANLSTPKIDVVALGNSTALSALKNSDVTLSVDVSSLIPGAPPSAVPVPLVAKAPDGIQVVLPSGGTTLVTLSKSG